MPQPGDTVLVSGRCGAQFRGRMWPLRVTGVRTYTHTPDHMVWLSGYELDENDIAVEHRPELLVEHAGLELIHRPARPRNAGPARRAPQQRAIPSTTRSNR